MRIVADDKIPFLRGVFEPYAEVRYLPGGAIRREDLRDADALITREQMVTMLYRFANSPEVAATGFGQFTDGASVSDWAVDAMAWALNNGVITGMGDGILSPAGSATRAQAAAMLMRFVEA